MHNKGVNDAFTLVVNKSLVLANRIYKKQKKKCVLIICLRSHNGKYHVV